MNWIDVGLMVIGFAGGVAVGIGFVAFLVVLNIIPRLIQMTKSIHYIKQYEFAVIIGVLFFLAIDIYDIKFSLGSISLVMIGLFAGTFIGLFAAALTEVINVIPIIAKRLGLQSYVVWLLMAMVIGKIIGTLVGWYVMVIE